MNVSDNLRIIQDEIEQACSRSDRNPADIKIVAVTKYVSTERAEEAVKAGIINLGENRDEGLLEKYTVLKDVPQWHFIGSLQTRKVKSIIDIVEYIHSLDRLSLAKEIQKRAKRTVKCLVQVNVSGEESKHGMEPEETLEFIESLKPLHHISVVGLMTMAPLTEDEATIRTSFRKLKELQLSIQKAQLDHAPCTELSMGMSNDYQIAIEEGATFIRIGTALVGDDS